MSYRHAVRRARSDLFDFVAVPVGDALDPSDSFVTGVDAMFPSCMVLK